MERPVEEHVRQPVHAMRPMRSMRSMRLLQVLPGPSGSKALHCVEGEQRGQLALASLRLLFACNMGQAWAVLPCCSPSASPGQAA